MEIKSAWDLVWYGGIALTLLAALFLLLRGDVIPRVHHQAVVEELRRSAALITEDRDEWREHANTLSTALDRLSDAVLQGRRP